MIYTVPNSKKIYYNLNESIFDDNADIFNDEVNNTLNILGTLTSYYERQIPVVEQLLNQLDIFNYEIRATNQGLSVDVHNHLYLPNRNLNNIPFHLFYFNVVDGNVNMSGNNLTDWEKFPKYIKGNCYANFNLIKTFEGAPNVSGIMDARRQKKKTLYPLTNENYIKYMNHTLDENDVYLIKYNQFGKLQSINENENKCVIKCEDNRYYKVKLNEVEYYKKLNELFK